jgi:signal transduction histidine kinase
MTDATRAASAPEDQATQTQHAPQPSRTSWFGKLRAGDVDTISQLFVLLAAGNAVWYATLSEHVLGVYSNYFLAAGLMGLYFVRRQGWINRVHATWLLVLGGYIDITINIAVHGGVWSPVLAWYVALPLPALFVLGVRAMAGMVLLSLVTVFIIAWAQIQDLLPHFVYSDDKILWAALVFTGLALSISILPVLYHGMHQGLLKGLNEKNAELQRVRDDLLDEQHQKDEFLASVSHELRTPMNAIIGFLQAIEPRPGDDPQSKEMLGHMEHSAKHLMTIINDLLDMSQMRAGKLSIDPRKTNLHKLVNDISRTFKPQLDERGIELRMTIDAQVPQWVMLDQDRLSQVLINLLGNAAKFTSKGFVSIHVSHTPTEHIRFEVQDTGRGIQEQHLERVFDRFSDITNRTRRDYGGTGLGLSICRQLVELQNGHIGVHSQLGQGATFWFELPLDSCAPPADIDPLPTSEIQTSRPEVTGRVLIVDDSFINRLVAKQLLLTDLPNLDIVEADGSQTALDEIARHPVDLILMDVVMPERDGIETTAVIRASDQATVIVGLTADVTPNVKSRCLSAGMNDVMTKPFERKALVERVRLGLIDKR